MEPAPTPPAPTHGATPIHATSRIARIAGAVGLLAAVALCPFPVGCQDQFWWGVMALVALPAAALVLGGAAARGRFLREKWLLVLLVALAVLMLVQLIPLPRGLVGALSSRRVELAGEAASALGANDARFLPMTASTKQTRDALLLFLVCALAFAASSLVFRRSRQLRLLYACLGVAGTLMALYAAIVALDDGARLHGAYTNANRFASLLGMCLLASVAWRLLAARAGSRAQVIAATVAAAACGLAFVATLSRMGIASLSAAVLLLTFLALRREEAASNVADTRARRLLAVGASVAASAVLASLLTSFDPVWERYSVLFDQDLAGNGRVVCWGMALGIVPDFPVLGSGAGSFQHVFPLYQEPGRLSGFWKYAHNDYLNALTDLGVVGIALVIAAAALWYRAAWRASQSPSTTQRVASWTGIGAVTFVALHSLADFVLKQPANALIFATLAGATAGVAVVRDRIGPRPRTRAPLAVAALIGVAAVFFIIPVMMAGRAYPLPAPPGDARSDAPALRRSLARDPCDVDLRYRAARSTVAGEEPTPDQRASALSLLTAGPTDQMFDARALYLAGVLMWRSGDDRADAAMRAASRLARAYPSITRAVGTFFVRRLIEARGAHPFALQAAVDSLDMANRTAPTAGGVRSSLAMLESVGAAERLADVVPDVEWAVALLADHHARHRRPGAAAETVEAFLASHEGAVSARFYHTLAGYRDGVGDVQGATLARIAYVMGTPGARRLSLAAAVVRELSTQKRNAEAAMFVRAFARRHPREPAATRARAEFALLSREYLTAYRLLTESVAQAGGPDDHYALAALALKLRRPIEAERHLDRAIEERPSVPRYWVLRAEVRAKAGEIDLAIQDLDAALHARPRDDAVRLKLARLLLDAKQMGRLVALWRAASAERPNDAFVLEHLARALFASARFDDAVAAARKAHELAPGRASVTAFLKKVDPDGPWTADEQP